MVPKTVELLVIVGPTASGKTDLAIRIAKLLSGEVISADSRTIYKDLNIGTAKPTTQEMQGVTHHMIDFILPGQVFSAAEFKKQAETHIEEIASRRHLPILVGGTGLYVFSVIYNYKFGTPPNFKRRQELSKLSLEELQRQALKIGIKAEEIDFKNKRHLLRAIENEGVIKSDTDLRPNTLVVGLMPEKSTLEKRISNRTEHMIEKGFVNELKTVVNKYGWENNALTGIGYNAFKGYLEGTKTLNEAKQDFIVGDKKLAKRQITWFKRSRHVNWFADSKEAEQYIINKLS